MEEKYAPVSGMTEPEVPKKKRNVRTALLILGAGVAIVVVALFTDSVLWAFWERKNSSLRRFRLQKRSSNSFWKKGGSWKAGSRL